MYGVKHLFEYRKIINNLYYMQLKRLSFLLLFICGYLTCVQSQTTVLNPQTDKKLLKQFQDAKLGLFIH